LALPIDDVLPELIGALDTAGRAVLQAPPGAGKTTGVPPALLAAGAEDRIVMLEPRRLAARAAAERMAEVMGEPCGRTVGYRIRGEAKVSDATRIEVVTEGILTRMVQDAPDLAGIGTVIFDEFHERSLNADLGLALTWEARGALRPDLRILVMSATLDAGPVAEMLDNAPLISSEGRAFPVDTRWLDRAPGPETRWDRAMADLIGQAMGENGGSCLAFLPGEGEIHRVAALLAGRLPPDVRIRPLYGALPFRDQRAAIRPEAEGRKLVLATSIAETSLTIEDVRIVVDGGKARRARFDPGRGMSRLVTEDVSRAEAEQRRGRAGRVAPGVCYRLWTRGQEGARPAFPPAEIEVADLSSLALELAQWGGTEGLRFLTPPPEKALAEARTLLAALGALDDAGRITAHGRELVRLPLHPRLGHLLRKGGPGAARLAALLSERDPMRGADAGCDLTPRLRALDTRDMSADAAVIARIREEAKRLKRHEAGPPLSPGAQAALAYPDRIGLRRKGDAPRYLLSGGAGAVVPEGDPMGQARLIVATDLDGDRREGRIRAALPLTETELRALHGHRIAWRDTCQNGRRAAIGSRPGGRNARRPGARRPPLGRSPAGGRGPRALRGHPCAGTGGARLVPDRPPFARAHPVCGGRGCLRRGAPRTVWRTGPCPISTASATPRGSHGSTRARPCAPGRLAGHGRGRPPRPATLDLAARAQPRHRLWRRRARDRGAPAGGAGHHRAPERGARSPADPHGAPVAGQPPDPGHDGPPRFLGRVLRRCAQGHARAIPQAPLARGPDHRRPDASRPAETGLITSSCGNTEADQGAPRPGKVTDAQRHPPTTPVSPAVG
jgi:ATP-dependent helicase HrpB